MEKISSLQIREMQVTSKSIGVRLCSLVDSTGKQTYTFAIEDNDNDPSTFFNLILKYDDTGVAKEPFLLKYTMDETFLAEYLTTGSLENYSGKVKKIRLGDQNSTNNRRGSASPGGEIRSIYSGDEDDCEGSNVTSGGNTNGGGGDPTGGDLPPSNGGGLSCTTYIITNTWYSQACGGGTCEEPIVTGRNSSVYTVCARESDLGEARGDGEDDCNPDEGEIPMLNLDHIILDPSFIDTKIECIYDQLQELSGGFKNAIKKFDGEFPVSHLRFTVSNSLPSTSAARTIAPVGTSSTPDYMITIAFNGDESRQAGINFRPALLSAKTFAHEIIHAEMYRKLMSLINQGTLRSLTGGTLNTLLENGDFPGIYDYYRRYGKGWQHEQMAAHYVETIAGIAKEFDSASQTDQFYTDLAWEGLTGTQAWNELPQSAKDRIDNTLKEYIKANRNDTCN